jgi:hypothetical protein
MKYVERNKSYVYLEMLYLYVHLTQDLLFGDYFLILCIVMTNSNLPYFRDHTSDNWYSQTQIYCRRNHCSEEWATVLTSTILN